MSRIVSWVLPVAIAAAVWFGWTEGKPRFERWKQEKILAEACRLVNERVHKGLSDKEAAAAVSDEVQARLAERAKVTVDETMFTVDLWQERCVIEVEFDDGTKISVNEPFPD
jgi:urease gamma subunit